MNTGQTILSIGALILLGTTVLSTNRASLQHGAIITQTEVGIYAVSLAQAKIEEASGKAFDEYSAPNATGDGDVITSVSLCTASGSLGKESGETYPNFDDVDDYNYYSGTNPYVLYVPGVDTFHIQTTVFYVDTAAPDTKVSTQTWHKKLTVKVWPNASPWAADNPKPDTVTMTYIYSYWWFR